MKKITVFLFVFIIGVLGLAGCAGGTSADPSWTKIKDAGSLVIGVSEKNLPLTYRNSSGNVTGFDIETANEVCRRLSLTGDLVVIDPSEIQQKLDDGSIDCYWSGLQESNREVVDPYDTTSAYLRNDDIFLLPINSKIKNIAQLKKKKLGLFSGSSGEEALERATQLHSSLQTVETYGTIEEGFSALNTGTVDVLVMGETVARYFMNLNPDRYRIMTRDDGKEHEPLHNQNCVIALRSGEKALQKKLEEALESMHKDGKMQEIAERWFGSNIAINPSTD